MNDAAPIRAGLIGRGIQASSSPAIHEREARAAGVALTYHLIDFDQMGLGDDALGAQLETLAGLGFSGVNVTHPFKQAVMPLLDEIEDTAAALGAVNCVAFRNGRSYGFNSDWTGFAFLLEHELGDAAQRCVAQLGAGGAGSATAYALLARGVEELRLCDTAAERAGDLAARLQAQFPAARIIVTGDPAAAITGAEGVVQATPIGMKVHPGVPFDPNLLDPGQWLADIIYFPRETELVLAAKARGVRAVGGSAMVVGQASAPFRQFTGCEPDRERMLREFLAADLASDGANGEACAA